jgi:hypothetical protein
MTVHTPIKILHPDSKGRVTLGAIAKGISSYRMTQDDQGRLVLEPFVEIPERERWLHHNPEALASLKRGIADAEAGRVSDRGSFLHYLDDEDV